jgi:hypothetical protein
MTMKRALVLLAVNAALGCTAYAQAPDPNPALNHPDEVSWQLFAFVNRPAPGTTGVVFETWASNEDTFTANPKFPGASGPPNCGPLVAGTAPPVVLATLNPKILNVPALEALAPKVPGLEPHVVPGGTENVPSEEVRHNEVTFNHIFCNKLYTKAGLRMAFASGQPISFPIDSIEVKANWKPAGNRNPSEFYMNTASDGKRYALVSMHIISKRVPNWTWATFEQKDNPGRCDFIGCQDHFGATTPDVDSNPTPGGRYNPCIKTPAVKKVFMDAGMPALWDNYCLKGSQVDFTTATGVTTRLGNSVTEDGFVETSSCMTCHSRSAVGATGRWVYGPGFITSPNPAICPPPPGQTACSPNGAPNPAWFLNNLGQANQSLLALQTDFVFSIARFAIGQ